jgi:hypothetical protein
VDVRVEVKVFAWSMMKRAVVWTFFWWQEGQNQRPAYEQDSEFRDRYLPVGTAGRPRRIGRRDGCSMRLNKPAFSSALADRHPSQPGHTLDLASPQGARKSSTESLNTVSKMMSDH